MDRCNLYPHQNEVFPLLSRLPPQSQPCVRSLIFSRLKFNPPGFDFGEFPSRQLRFFRLAFPAPFLFELDFWRILTAGPFPSDDCRGIDACVSDQFFCVILLHDRRVNGIWNSFLGKHFERSGKRCLGRNLAAIFPSADSSQTRIRIQIFNQHLRCRKVVYRFQEKCQRILRCCAIR